MLSAESFLRAAVLLASSRGVDQTVRAGAAGPASSRLRWVRMCGCVRGVGPDRCFFARKTRHAALGFFGAAANRRTLSHESLSRAGFLPYLSATSHRFDRCALKRLHALFLVRQSCTDACTPSQHHAAPAHEARRGTQHSKNHSKNIQIQARPRRTLCSRVRRERSFTTHISRLAPVQRRNGRRHAAHAG